MTDTSVELQDAVEAPREWSGQADGRAQAATDGRCCVVIISHVVCDTTVRRYEELRADLPARFDVTLVLTTPIEAEARARGVDDVVVLDKAEIFLPEYGKKSASGRITPGNVDLIMLAFWRRRPGYDRIWMVEFDVFIPAGPGIIERLDEASGADLIVSLDICTRAAHPTWMWWDTFEPGPSARPQITAERSARSLFCIARYGHRFLPALDRAYRDGWSGHNEATGPSVAIHEGLLVEGLQTIAARALGRRILSMKSFGVVACEADDPDFIYHPIKTREAEAHLLRQLRSTAWTVEAAPRVETDGTSGDAEAQALPGIGASVLTGAERALFLRLLTSGEVRSYAEFGAGASTLLAVEMGVRVVVSVDSDADWIATVAANNALRSAVELGSLTILHGDIGKTREWGYPVTPGDASVGRRYFERPWATWEERNAVPDLVFVDGRYRVACCLAAALFLRRHLGPGNRKPILINDVGDGRPSYDVLRTLLAVREQRDGLLVLTDDEAVSDAALLAALEDHAADSR